MAWLGLIACGCTNTITPPQAVADPVEIWLLDHGRHPSLVIPDGNGDLLRYVYGDWTWYAEGKTGVWQGIMALFWPTPAGLGRRELTDIKDLEAMNRADPYEAAFILKVEKARVEHLRAKLESYYRSLESRAHFNEDYGLHFVPHPKRYSALRNCNHLMAQWLGELGCEVRGLKAFCQWRVR